MLSFLQNTLTRQYKKEVACAIFLTVVRLAYQLADCHHLRQRVESEPSPNAQADIEAILVAVMTANGCSGRRANTRVGHHDRLFLAGSCPMIEGQK